MASADRETKPRNRTTKPKDLVANKVLQECCQDIVDQVNIDEVILSMHAKSRLTVEELNRLNSIGMTEQEKKRLFYTTALANKGSAVFKDFIAILTDRPGNYAPHNDLVTKLTQRRDFYSRQPGYRRIRKRPSKHGQERKAKKRKHGQERKAKKRRTDTRSETSSESESDAETSSESEPDTRSETTSESSSDRNDDNVLSPETSSESEPDTRSETTSESSSDSNDDNVLSPVKPRKVSHAVFVLAFAHTIFHSLQLAS